jgi:GNAT superfamily N-acetyltransferase
VSAVACRPYRSEDEADLLALFRAVYGPDSVRRTSSWRYLAPAPWPHRIHVAEADGRIVGAQPSHGIELLVDRVPLKGLLLLDVMTHPDYRRRGVFAGVVEGLRKSASDDGYRVFLTTPNRDAGRGFARLPSWTRLGELVPWVSIGDTATLVAAGSRWGALLRPLGALGRALQARERSGGANDLEEYPGDRFADRLWRTVIKTARCQLVRDSRLLSWRFGPGSGRRYAFLAAGTSDKPEALVVYGEGRFLGRDVLTLVDIMADPDRPASGARLLRRLTTIARREHRAAVVGWFSPGSCAETVVRSAGFLRVPKPLRARAYSIWASSDLPVVSRGPVLDLRAWSMTLTDSDLA